MIGGSIVVRNALDDDDAAASNSPPTEDLTIVCVEELEAVCADLDANVTVEPAGTTAARLASGEGEPFDAWVTFAPFATSSDATSDVVGSTRLGFAMRSDRAAVLSEYCGGGVTWRCVGEVADQPWAGIGGDDSWGTIKPAHPEPVGSGLGRLVLGSAVASFLGTEDYSRIDWEASDDFPGWFDRLERAVPSDAFEPGVDPYEKWLSRRLIGYDVVATTEAEAAGRDNVTVIYPAPVAAAQVAVLPGAGGGEPSDDLVDDVRDALSAHGYDTESTGTDGLPSAGVLEALTEY